MVTAHLLRHTCFRFPADISYSHLWTFSKTIYSPCNTFSSRQSNGLSHHLKISVIPFILKSSKIDWPTDSCMCFCFEGFVWIFFFFGSAWTRNTHCYSPLPDHVHSPHCLTPIKVHLPFLFLHWWNLFWSKIKQRVMSATQWIAHTSKFQYSTHNAIVQHNNLVA